MPKVYKCTWGQLSPPNTVYVGRPSVWGNPFPIGKKYTREESLALFEVYARDLLTTQPDWLKPLIGKNLSCWCAPLPCHANIIMKLIEEVYPHV